MQFSQTTARYRSLVLLATLFGSALQFACDTAAPDKNQSQSTSRKQPTAEIVRRDRIPVNTVCYLGPAGVFDTSDDIALYEIAMFNRDGFSANNMLSDQFHFWLPDKAGVKVLYHGPFQGYVAPDAPQSTREALSRFEICQIQVLDGVKKGKVGWIVDTELRCPTQKGK
jgi:hypothetical protein